MRKSQAERRSRHRKASFTAGLVLVGALVVILQARWIAEHKPLFTGKIEVTRAGDDTKWVRCSTCRGQGRVTLGDAEDRPILCPVCFGVRGRSIVIEDDLEGVMRIPSGMETESSPMLLENLP